MLHRIRRGLAAERTRMFDGPVKVDEGYFGGKRKNMSNARRDELKDTGRGPVGKTAVAGMKDRKTGQVAAQVVERTDGETLKGFIDGHAGRDATLYTDDATAYRRTRREHETVRHSVSEYVKGQAHTNGVESRYVDEFAGRHNIRDLDTIDQMAHVAASMVGRRLLYRDLIADNGRSAAAG